MALGRKKGLFESNRVLFLPIESIFPNPSQPRRFFSQEGLEELASSIKEHGVLQPLSVRKVEGSYELVSGERRLRAAKLAGLTEVPCILVRVDSEESSLLALVENLQRRDLDFVEEAAALARLIRTYGLSQEETARRIGKSQSAVANKLRLLRLSPDVLTLLRERGFTERHARALLRLGNDELQLQAARALGEGELEQYQGSREKKTTSEEEEYTFENFVVGSSNKFAHAAARAVAEGGFTVSRTEEYVEALLSPAPTATASPPKRKPTFLIKDVRFFLNTITRGLSMMNSAGVNAACERKETEDSIFLTIRIPKAAV